MAEFSNAQKLAAVVSQWARPAIAQLAGSNLMRLPMMQSLQATLYSSGLVGQGYDLARELQPMIQPVADAMIQPLLARYIGNIPDDQIPRVAHAIVDQLKRQKTCTLLDGLITLDADDIRVLGNLLEKNLPVTPEDTYQVLT